MNKIFNNFNDFQNFIDSIDEKKLAELNWTYYEDLINQKFSLTKFDNSQAADIWW